MVIILFSANFIAVCEEVDCSAGSAPLRPTSALQAVIEVILTTSYLGAGAHLLIGKWLTDQEIHDWESPQPISSLSDRCTCDTTSYGGGVRVMVWRMRRASGCSDFSDSSQAERFWNRAAEAKSFIVIPHGGAVQQLKCLLSVPLKVSNNKSPG